VSEPAESSTFGGLEIFAVRVEHVEVALFVGDASCRLGAVGLEGRGLL